MSSYTTFDEKANYEQRCHRRNRPSISSGSTHSSLSEKDDNPPPYYARTFYNSTADKPLPPLPVQKRRVRFAVRPLPPLPEGQRFRSDSDSSVESMEAEAEGEGDNAYWASEKSESGGYGEKSRS